MIIVMQSRASAKQIAATVARVEALGYRVHLSQGEERTIIGVIGDDRPIDRAAFELLDGVEKTVPILKPFKLASRDMHPQDTIVALNGIQIGGPPIVIMAGPCAVESRAQIIETAIAVKEAGAQVLRGGAYKPRYVAVQFSRAGRRGPGTAGRSARSDGPADRDGGDGAGASAAGGEVRRHASDRRAQHAELRAAARGRRSRIIRCC